MPTHRLAIRCATWLAICLLTTVGFCGTTPQEPSVAAELPVTVIAWDETEKTAVITYGDPSAVFSFKMTNVSREPVVVEKINLSCGCTTLDAKPGPWKLMPGANESFKVSMNLLGKIGTVTKSVFVTTDHGSKTLLITADVKPIEGVAPGNALPSAASISPGAREQNMILAKADRQAVFQGDCAACHTRFAEGKMGGELYLGACAICHDAAHRASMVPDLRISKGPRDAAYWREHISNGREGTLMPAFAKSKKGILSDEQIESLVKYLTENPPTPKTEKP